jgi:hypothetical protein
MTVRHPYFSRFRKTSDNVKVFGRRPTTREPQAQPAGVRKPAEKETAGNDARSSRDGLWGFEGVAW